MIKLEDIKNCSIKIKNNNMSFSTNSSNSTITIPGYVEIGFILEIIQDSNSNILNELFTNKYNGIDIDTPLGKLIDCIIDSYDANLDITDPEMIELTIEGKAKRIDPYINILFKGETKERKVKVSIYNEVVKSIGKDITYEDYQKQAFVEEL